VTGVRAAPQKESINPMKNCLESLKRFNPLHLMEKLKRERRPKPGCQG